MFMILLLICFPKYLNLSVVSLIFKIFEQTILKVKEIGRLFILKLLLSRTPRVKKV